MTLPMMHSSTVAGSIPARAMASRTTIAPSSVALRSFRAPRNLPVGVRTAETMTLSFILLSLVRWFAGSRVVGSPVRWFVDSLVRGLP
jgi:hypothetical protein